MRVLLINYLFSPHEAGGAERVVADLAAGLGRLGCRVLVMTAGRREEKRELPSGVSVWRIAHRSPYFNDPRQPRRTMLLRVAWRLLAVWNPWVFLKTLAVLRRFRPDVVHVHNFHGFSPAVFSAARLRRIPAVFTPCDFLAVCRRYSLYAAGRNCDRHCPACRLWARWVSLCLGPFHLLCLSRFSRDLFLRHLRPASARVITLPAPGTAADIAAARAWRRRQENKRRTVFLFLGRLSDLKGIPWLLESFPGALPAPALILIAGDGPLRPQVEEACRRQPRIFKFLGRVDGERKRRLLLASDVLLCLSAAGDMSPLVIAEAFACGMPVIASAAGAMPERVVDGETGWLVPHGSRAGLVAAVRAACAERSALEERRGCCLRAAQASDHDRYLAAVLEGLRQAAGQRPSTG